MTKDMTPDMLQGGDPSIASLVDLSDKVAVVTGGGAGIGRAISLRLAEAGSNVVIADFNLAGAQAVADEITGAGGAASARQIDVSDTSALVGLVADISATHGRLDIWVNNAGIYPPTPIFDTTEDDWDRTLDINLRGTYFAAREAGRWMVKLGNGGVILNIASIAAYRAGPPGLAPYAASKAGVIALTKGMAWSFGGFGVRVVGIAPGVILTDRLREGLDGLAAMGANVGNRATHLALNRLGSGDDIARAALFLCSGLAEFITGITLVVDGGDVVLGQSQRPQIDELGTL